MPFEVLAAFSFKVHNVNNDYEKGRCYEEGLYVKKDMNKALSYYKNASKAGDGKALFKLGEYYHAQGQIEVAAREFYRAALKNIGGAEEKLKACCTEAFSMPEFYLGELEAGRKNWQAAKKYYDIAAEKENHYAIYALAEMYEKALISITENNAESEQNSEEKILSLYYEAAAKGSSLAFTVLTEKSETSGEASFYLASLYKALRNNKKALFYYEKASRLNDLNATVILAQYYEQESKQLLPEMVEKEFTEKAVAYYLICLQKHYQEAIPKLKTYLEHVSDPTLKVTIIIELASYYHRFLQDPDTALGWYFEALKMKEITHLRYKKNSKNVPSLATILTEIEAIASQFSSKVLNITQSLECQLTDANVQLQFSLTSTLAVISGKGTAQSLRWLMEGIGLLVTHTKELREFHSQFDKALGIIHQSASEVMKEGLALYWQVSTEKALRERAITIIQKISEHSNVFTDIAARYFFYEGNKELAINLFQANLAKHYQPSLEFLKVQAAEENVQAQVILGAYYEKNHNRLEAIEYYIRAAEQGHKVAQHYFNETSFIAEHYLLIAKKYHTGAQVKANLKQAIAFYLKAHALQELEASYALGQIYENGSPLVAVNIDSTFAYYKAAALLGHKKAFGDLERIVQQHLRTNLAFQLGELYLATNHPLIKALPWYKMAADSNEEAAGKKLKELSQENAENAYAIGMFYQASDQTENAIAKAIEFYALALPSLHDKAQQQMEAVAASGNSEAQYILGVVYYHKTLKDDATAVKWCLKAAEKQHAKALEFLTTTQFSDRLFHSIATEYERGGHVARNVRKAIQYYEKAAITYPLSNYCLGQIYEKGAGDINVDKGRAISYYLKAASQQHLEALKAAEPLVLEQKDANLVFHIAEIYVGIFANALEALPWYKIAIESGHLQARTKLEKLVVYDGELAYQAGLLFEKDPSTILSKTEIYTYYILATKKDHPNALKRLNELASAKDVEARYLLGYKFYYDRKLMNEAAKWILLAANQNHPVAMRALHELDWSAEVCLWIATKYTQGWSEVAKNGTVALEFLKKASTLGNSDASFQLAQHYESLSTDAIPDAKAESIFYYLTAATQKNSDALPHIARLTETMQYPEILEFELAKIYIDVYGDGFKSVYWFKQAADHGHEEAPELLLQIAQVNPELAVAIAELYEQETDQAPVRLITITYYTIAMSMGSKKAEERLTFFATQELLEPTEAKYALGFANIERNNLKEGIKWYVIATQEGHAKAQAALIELAHTNPDYSMLIAKEFDADQPYGSKKMADYFYSTANLANDRDANFRLAQIYQCGYQDLSKDEYKAFNYYLSAARKGHPLALTELESLTEGLNAEMQLKLAELFFKEPAFKDYAKAEKWYVLAAETDHKVAQAELKKFNDYMHLNFSEQNWVNRVSVATPLPRAPYP